MEKIIVPATPETATSTLPWPPGPRMNSLSVLVFDPPNDKMLLSLDCPANDVQQEWISWDDDSIELQALASLHWYRFIIPSISSTIEVGTYW
jgi:hypothetical protein